MCIGRVVSPLVRTFDIGYSVGVRCKYEYIEDGDRVDGKID